MVSTGYSRVVDGLELPAPLAGHPALELCNTRAGWGEDEPKEYLATPRHLAVLARAVGVAPVTVEAGEAELERALALREALYGALTGGDGFGTVAREAEAAAAAARLTRDGWVLPERPDLPVLAFARAGAELLLERPRLGRCPGHGCGWLFLDPRGRRRWCTMATCGNRAKARRHAARVRAR